MARKPTYEELKQRVKELEKKALECKRAEKTLLKARDEQERRFEERLRFLSSQLLTILEDERKRIAQELHDSIGQSLSAIKFSLEMTLHKMAQQADLPGVKSLEGVIPVIQSAIEEVRKIVMNLRPSILDDLGILATIAWFCREFQTIYSGIRIEQQIKIQKREVPDPLKIVIFRVLQEAMNNIAKHSKADFVRLFLGKTDNTIKLAVEDNGRGFDVESILSLEGPEKGFGITSMKERTELSGGSFSIESNKGAGTVVQASWTYKGIESIS